MSFNRTGHPIPRSSSYGARDVTDSNGFKYVTSPDEMGNLLESKLGKPRNLKTQADAIGRRGIILFEHCRSLHGGSHVELWDGETTALPTGGEVICWRALFEMSSSTRRHRFIIHSAVYALRAVPL